MPASSSETKNRWRKRKRGPKPNNNNNRAKPKPQYEDDEIDEQDDQEEYEDPDLDQQQQKIEFEENHHHQNPNTNIASHPAVTIAPESEVVLNSATRISDLPYVVKHIVHRPHSSVMAIVTMERANQLGQSRGEGQNSVVLENLSYGQLQALSAVPADSPILGEQDKGEGYSSAYVITPPGIMEGKGVVKRFGRNMVHIVPMHADWFSPTTVHRLERQVVPHYFSGKSADHTPEKYMECRNRIVGRYMENPEDRLSVANCHGLVAGVAIDDMTRIVRFLDHWGIINYCASTPDHGARNDGSCLIENSNGELSVPATALKSIDSLIRFDKPKCGLKASNVCPEMTCNGDEGSDLDIRIRERLSENQCNYCSRPIPIVYYQSQKEVDVLLCTDCFHEGRFVTGHSSLDFMKVNSMKDYGDLDGECWTDQETLLLLEAMELYNENWNEIAEHVGTKSKAQCILHFLRLPIDDAPLDNIDVPSSSISSKSMKRDNCGRSHSKSNGKAAGSGDQDPDCESRLPFANSGNPVMSLVAFLASAVGPRVAAACAHECLAVLADNVHASGNMGQMDGSEFGNRMNVESMHGKEHGPHGESTSQQKDENLGQGPRSQVDAEVSTPLSAEKVRAAAKAGLAAAATKAKLFADHEEREIQRLSANIINHQLKRLELKLKQFAEVETLLMKECEQVERLRQRIAAERALILSSTQQFGGSSTGGVPRSTTVLPGGNSGPATVVNNNNAGNNNRPQVVSGSSSQPFVSGNHWGQYGGAQAKMPLGSITR